MAKVFSRLGAVAFAACIIAAAGFSGAAFAADDDLMAGGTPALTAQVGGDPSSVVPMLRLYNPNSGEHFYTASTVERDNLVSLGWHDEGAGWNAPTTSGSPVYRLYNANGGEHHYTMNAAERDMLVGVGWKDEGIGWYSADAGSNRVGLYRDYNPNAFANNHNYTTNMAEHAMLASIGWSSEGGSWYGLAPDDYAEGWLLDGDAWRCYRGGSPLKGEWAVLTSPPAIVGVSAPTGYQRYWLDGSGALAISRLIDPGDSRDVAAGYYAYAKAAGDVVRGKYDNLAGRVYVADNDGRLAEGSGWLVTAAYDGALQRYYLDGSMHAAVSGSFEVDGKSYFGLGDLGYVARNMRLPVGGTWMHADNDGVLSVDPVVSRLQLMAQGYSSPSPYLIMVDIDDPTTVVFEGSQGNWGIKFVWECCTGAPGTPTVEGVYSVNSKGYSFGEDHGYSCYYWTQFYGDYLFHSRKYFAYTHDLMDGRIGERVSEGCVRLYDEDAIWIQDNIPVGTTVVTTR